MIDAGGRRAEDTAFSKFVSAWTGTAATVSGFDKRGVWRIHRVRIVLGRLLRPAAGAVGVRFAMPFRSRLANALEAVFLGLARYRQRQVAFLDESDHRSRSLRGLIGKTAGKCPAAISMSLVQIQAASATAQPSAARDPKTSVRASSPRAGRSDGSCRCDPKLRLRSPKRRHQKYRDSRGICRSLSFMAATIWMESRRYMRHNRRSPALSATPEAWLSAAIGVRIYQVMPKSTE